MYKLTGNHILKYRKNVCVLVNVVKFWYYLNIELAQCQNLKLFKLAYKHMVIAGCNI